MYKIRSRPGKPNQKKGPKRKVHEFHPFFVNSGVFPWAKQAQFTSNSGSNLPPRRVHEQTFLWFGLPEQLLIKSQFPINGKSSVRESDPRVKTAWPMHLEVAQRTCLAVKWTRLRQWSLQRMSTHSPRRDMQLKSQQGANQLAAKLGRTFIGERFLGGAPELRSCRPGRKSGVGQKSLENRKNRPKMGFFSFCGPFFLFLGRFFPDFPGESQNPFSGRFFPISRNRFSARSAKIATPEQFKSVYWVVADVWEKDVWEFQAKSGSSGSYCFSFIS